MIEAGKKTGSVLYIEPLHKELQECFGVLKDVNPDQVFSSRRGTQFGNQASGGDENINNNNTDAVEGNENEPQPTTSTSTDEKSLRKKPKSN